MAIKFKILRPLLRIWRSSAYSPGIIQRSLALGTSIGFSPTVGFQVLICLAICIIWNKLATYKVNTPSAIVGSLVVNPVTMGPVYYIYYKIGCMVLECGGGWSISQFGSVDDVTQLTGTVLYSLWIGSIPFMLIGFIGGGYLGNLIEKSLHKRRKKKLKLTASR